MEAIWRELETVVKGVYEIPKARLCGIETQILFTYHPSGKNTIGRYLNKKLATLIKTSR